MPETIPRSSLARRTAKRSRRTGARTAGVVGILGDTRGANLVEYVLLVGLVAILAMFAFRYFGRSVRAKTDRQSVTVQQHVQSEPK